MKRLIIPGLILLALLALFQWGNRILEQTLDAELPGLLTRQLGIPVTLAPIRTRISNLTVRSPKLVMGEPANPALIATGVMVSLQWSDLLRGEIRLRRASGDTLMVKPSLWPSNNSPWPTDYRFLDPYLPNYLKLSNASYVDSDGSSYTFNEPLWRRQSPGASVSWREGIDGKTVNIGAQLGSLDELLRLARMKLQITATASDKDGSSIAASMDIQPADKTGYKLNANINAAGMTAAVIASNQVAWTWPDKSTTSSKQLDIQKIRTLIDDYRADPGDPQTAAFLAMSVPRLSLPAHSGTVAIDEIRWQGQVGTQTTFDFTTGPEGVTVPALSSHGPTGTLQGQLNVTSSDAGWQLGLSAALEATEASASLAKPYLEANWFWREGSSKLTGQGDTWGSLLNSLRGDIALSGSHRGTVETPVTVSAQLDNRPTVFSLDTIEVKVGKGRITGSLDLSGEEHKHLAGKLTIKQLNLDSLIPTTDGAAKPGIPVPTYLTALPGIDLDWQLDISALTVRGLNIDKADITFTRTPDKSTVIARATWASKALLDLRLDAITSADKPTIVTLHTKLSRFGFAQFFQQASIFPDARTSGTITFKSRGNGVNELFKAMSGKADLNIDHRSDNNWQRAPNPAQQLRLSGRTQMVIDSSRIMGLEISELAVDSTLQNLTGTLSLVEGRKPWLEANLTSDKLDLANLAEFQSDSAEDGAESSSLDSLRQLGESRLTLKAKSVLAADLPLSNVSLRLSTAPDNIKIEQLDFSLEQGRLTSEGGIVRRKNTAELSLAVKVDNISLGELVADVPSAVAAPLSGTVSLHSSGTTFSSLLADLTGDIQLKASPGSVNAASAAPAEVDMTARQTADGMHAEIRRFQWQGSDLAGSVRYHRSTPPLLEVEISGGALSLLPWETAEDAAKNQTATKHDGSAVTKTAKASADLIGDVVMAPLRLISGPREAKPGDKLFSSTPLPVSWLRTYDASVKGKLDKLISNEREAADLEFSAKLLAGKLNIEATAGTLNGGSASGSISIDSQQQPTSVASKGTFKNLRGELVKAEFSRSGHFDISSSGQSQAELAANVNGLVYLELGKGALDYGDMMLLTADVATNMFETLIPGAQKSTTQLECAVSLGVFKDGIGTTPYGYAARTNLANLVGRIEINLKKELLHINFSSSSRKGLGLSVGNVFSNTVEVEGPLTDPRIEPNATGLLWRGWAAVMTGGLSVLGESVLKRALASEDPCKSVQKDIRKDFCPGNAAAAAFAMVCPPA